MISQKVYTCTSIYWYILFPVYQKKYIPVYTGIFRYILFDPFIMIYYCTGFQMITRCGVLLCRTRYRTRYRTRCNSISVYTDIGSDIDVQDIVNYTISCFTPSSANQGIIIRHYSFWVLIILINFHYFFSKFIIIFINFFIHYSSLIFYLQKHHYFHYSCFINFH